MTGIGLGASDRGGQAAQRWKLENTDKRYLESQIRADLLNDPDHHQGIGTQIEKVVVDPYLVHSQQFAEDGRKLALRLRGRRNERRGGLLARPVRRGECLAIKLAV